jgi:hypothetical protein
MASLLFLFRPIASLFLNQSDRLYTFCEMNSIVQFIVFLIFFNNSNSGFVELEKNSGAIVHKKK